MSYALKTSKDYGKFYTLESLMQRLKEAYESGEDFQKMWVRYRHHYYRNGGMIRCTVKIWDDVHAYADELGYNVFRFIDGDAIEINDVRIDFPKMYGSDSLGLRIEMEKGGKSDD